MQTAYRLNIDKAHICGMSMGGMIAQTFAINNPSRTLSLISIYSSSGRKEIGPTQELEKLKVPSLIIHGDEDPLVPVAGGKATADAIPNAELMIVKGMGHVLPNLNTYWNEIKAAMIKHIGKV